MKILMVSSECVPYAKSGGLADVVAALSRQLGILGNDIKILLPRYSFIDKKNTYNIIDKFTIPMGFHDEQVKITASILPESEIVVYFINHPLFTKRSGIYGEHGSHFYRDNHYRFALLSAMAVVLSEKLLWEPDIIHSHDWPTGLVSSYLGEYKKKGDFINTESVFTIHNTGYQGNFSKHDLHSIGLPWDAISDNKAHYKDTINFIKSGILKSKAVTTVSPSYAKEIRTEGFGHGLEKLLVSKKNLFTGILNGVDYTEWNPENDTLLEVNFSKKNLGNKWKLKEKLQKKSGLANDSKVALISIVGRLVDQKGFSELCRNNTDNVDTGAIEQICSNPDVQMVILGTGEKWIEEELSRLDKKLANLRVFLEFNNSLAHLIEAGSDFFLMPSKYEPCGLNQIYSLKYGTIPIVRKTGGLKDTVVDFFSDKEIATGFHIPEMSSESIVSTVNSVLELWRSCRKSIDTIRQRGLSMEFPWSKYATEYEELYKTLIA